MAEGAKSAEKELLKLIEHPEELELQKSQFFGRQELGGGKLLRKLSLGNLFAKATFNKKGTSKQKTFSLTPKLINQFLFTGTGLLFIYFVITFFSEASKFGKSEDLIYTAGGKEQKMTMGGDDKRKNLLEKIGGKIVFRNLFAPFSKKEEEETTAGEGLSILKLKDYKLVGISIEENPDNSYAMIENTKTGITFFLKKGEELDGVKVLEIFEEKVVLAFQGETLELR